MELLSVPLKKPTEVDVIKPLKNLIQSSYNGSPSDKTVNYSDAITEFSKLRNTAIWKVFEKYESSLEIIYGYYDQLCSLETKIPASELQIPFKWKDAFDKGSIFGGKISLTISSLAYEKVCVLFNIAALQSNVASSQSLDSDESLKLATKLFQQSAGIFVHLKSAAPAAISQESTPDLNPEMLGVLSSLMIAQAQEIFIIKAIRDNMKEIIIAKLCNQCEELYGEILRSLQKDSFRNTFEKEWLPIISGKQVGFNAMTQLYQSLVCRASKAFGEEISRLQSAVELFKTAQSRSGKANLFEEYASRAQRNLADSKKDNDFIYNEIIPDVKSLDPPGKALIAKALPVGKRMGQQTKEIFEELVPVVLHQAMTACESRKNEIVNVEILKLREATQTLNSVLANLNLPAAIEVSAGSGLPPSLTEKGKEVREKGGIDSVQALVRELPELLSRNREILDETDRLLNEENQSDNQLRAQFKERWTRTPSDKLTEVFRINAGKYRVVINNAEVADKTVRELFETNKESIEILSKPETEITDLLPSGNSTSVSNCSSVQKLRSLMESVETIKAERDVIESELKSATVNIKEQFLEALAQDGAINEPAISIGHIGKMLSPLQSQAKESIERQATLLADIQEAHKNFVTETGAGGNQRDALMRQLATAYDAFMQLQNNLKEGTKFYNDLTQLLVVFQNKISDFCFARRTEKEELLKDLTEESSRQSVGPSPDLPTHHGGAVTDANKAASVPQRPAPAAPLAGAGGAIPYPTQMQGMPIPFGASAAAPYPTYVAPPMPQGFNPYATLPYPTTPYNYQGFPQGPQHYGTYPGTYANQGQMPGPGGYPHQQPPPPQGW